MGNDQLIGGAGADVLVLEPGSVFLSTYWPGDDIDDFVRGTDKLFVDSAISAWAPAPSWT